MRLLRMAIMVALVATPALTLGANRPDDIDKKLIDLLKKAGKVIKDAKSMQCEATINTTATGEDKEKKQEIKVKATFMFERPNKFAMRSEHAADKNAGLVIVSDGKTMTTLAKRLKQYAEAKAPSNMAAIGRPLLQYGQPATGLLFQNILAEDPDEMLLDGVTKATLVGTQKVDGKDAHHLKFTQDQFDWELWIAAEGEPFIVKASSTHATPDGGQAVTVETYSKWKVNPELPKDAFEFKAPEGVKKVKVIGRQNDDDDPR